MPSQYLIALLLFVVLIALAALPSVRSFFADQLARLQKRPSPPPPQPSTGTTLIRGNGEEIDLPAGPEPRVSWASRVEEFGGQRRLVMVALVALVALVAAVQLYRYTMAPTPESFVVLVAPFGEPGGTVGQTGREVASALVGLLPEASGRRVIARQLSEPPASPAAALDILRRDGADALIWGTIDSGGMLDRESLQPMLAYQPSGPLAALGWDGYAGRFAIPTDYQLSSRSINGAVVLPALLGALADYDAGRFDAAFTTLGRLTDDYPAVAPALPGALRGNILWARGQYADAANEYRRALGDQPSADGTQAALLYNNLGAILQDAGDSGAPAEFNRAIAALQGRDLSQLRFNLGLQSLGASKPADAVGALEIARDLQAAPPTQLLLALGQAYRQNAQFDRARATFDTAARQVAADVAATTVDLHNVTTARLNSAVETERALLDLAQSSGARGPLTWELLGGNPLSMNALEHVREQIDRAVDDSTVASQLWIRLATAKDAASEPIAGQIATFQSQRGQDLLRERRRWQALLNLERGSMQGVSRPRGLSAVWATLFGDRTPVSAGRASLEDMLKTRPSDVDALILLGHSDLLSDDLPAAVAQFDKAAALAPQRPEPVYGQALAALPSDPARGRQLLARAIEINPAFFPARARLAAIAEDAKDWPTVIEQRRWFAANRPSVDNTLQLAAALQASGPGGYSEAEKVLLPLANQGNTRALIALAGLYQSHGNAADARAVMDRAVQVAPRDSSVAYAYGQLLEQQNDPEAARAQYAHAIEVNASDVQARLALGRLYASAGDSAAAGQQYRVALSAGANDPVELKRIGDVLLANGEYDSAATAYNRAITALQGASQPVPTGDEPPNTFESELYHGVGQANLKLGKLSTAQPAEQRALELRAQAYPEALVGLGDIALLQSKPNDAVDQYRAALKLNSQLIGAAIGLGRASGALGNWAVAQAQFRDAVNLDPTSAEAHLWLGEALVRQSDPGSAIREYARAIELKPNYPEAYFGLAQAQIAAGQSDLARDNLASALQLRPAYPEALLLQGKLFEQQSNDTAALDAYSKAIQASTTLAEPRYRRALVYIRYDKLDDAMADLQSAIDIQANFSEAHYWLGRTYLAQGKPKQARAELMLAIDQRGGTYPDARFYQGLAEEQLGQRNDAVASYQAALDQNTNGDWANEARTALVRLRQP
jgi:tetratricopeptide (TPR) repeat protein